MNALVEGVAMWAEVMAWVLIAAGLFNALVALVFLTEKKRGEDR